MDGPLLLVVEDAHWIDPSSKELLEVSIARTLDSAVMIVVTSRPTRGDVLTETVNPTHISLGRLSDDDIGEIARSVEGSSQLSDAEIERIVSCVDGIPLFAEEITATVIEHESLAGKFNLPETIEASIMARLDLLGEAKKVAQVGSVIGREFKYSQLAALVDITTPTLGEALSTLTTSGLLSQVGSLSDPTYRFKHSLVQDVAYEGLLRRERRDLHKRLAIDVLADNVKTREPEIVAHHLTEAGLLIEAIDYWKKAGTRASEASANAEAIAHFSRGLELIKELPGNDSRAALEFSFQVGLSGPLIAEKGYTSEELQTCISKALSLSKNIEHTPEIYSILYSQWAFLLTSGSMAESQRVAVEFSQQAERQNNEDAMYARHRMLGASHMCLGELDKAVAELNRAITRYEPERHARLATAYGVDIRVACLCFMSEVLWLLGHVDQAKNIAAKALGEAKKTKHLNSIAISLHFCGLVSFLYRDREAVRGYMDEMMKLAATQSIGAWPTLGRAMLGWSRLDEGDFDGGWKMLSEGVSMAVKAGVSMFIPFFYCRKAEELMSEGRLTEAGTYLTDAESLIARTGEVNYKGELLRLRAELLLRLGHLEAVGGLFEEAIDLCRAQNCRAVELRVATSYAMFLAEHGEVERGLALLSPIVDTFEEGQQCRDVLAAQAVVTKLN